MIIATALFLLAPLLFDCGLQFEKEKITISVSGDECILQGDYYFRNSSPVSCETQIFYPLIDNSDLPFPHFISVTDLYEKDALDYGISKAGINFILKIPPYDSKVIRVEYHQKARSNRFEYILTTTAQWEKPLKSADFLISLPKELRLSSISIPYDSTQTSSEVQRFYIHKDDFMPKCNLVFEWRTTR